jgi:hypothetical protein
MKVLAAMRVYRHSDLPIVPILLAAFALYNGHAP